MVYSVSKMIRRFEGHRAVLVRIEPHQVFALSSWDFVADQCAIAVPVEAMEDRFEVEAGTSSALTNLSRADPNVMIDSMVGS